MKYIYTMHNYSTSVYQTDSVFYEAGGDSDCGYFTPSSIVGAVNSGDLKENTLRNAMKNLVRVQMRLGMFDDPSSLPWSLSSLFAFFFEHSGVVKVHQFHNNNCFSR